MRIGINGTGIAGPALAYWLRRFGHEPVLFERAPALRTGGYVVDFWGLGYELAERMGILPRLIERGYAMRAVNMVDAQGRQVASMDVEPLRVSAQGRFISVARSDISSALFDACAGVPVHFGTSVVDWEQDDAGVTTVLSDGRHERFDLVIGADGLHSKVRALAFGPEPSNEHSLDCHVAAFRLRGYPHRDELTYVSHTEPKRQVARMSLRDDETLVLFICRSELVGGEPDPRDVKENLWRAFGNMGWEAQQILVRMEAVEDIYFDHVSQVRLDTWTRGRVALVGDAAACVSFLAGEGTGLAIIEAYVLAGELHRAGRDWQRGLEQYQSRLRTFVRAKQEGALRFRGFFTPETSLGLKFRDLLVNAFSKPFVAKHVLNRALRDDLDLPRYEKTGLGPS
jgi:2-polyprenyl-6-methoxyphenol hydroxylase-like FAD-dependent oxidoreductase